MALSQACSAQCAYRETRCRGFKLSHEAVAATVAEEFELVSLVSGMVSMVAGELDEWHAIS